MPRGTQLTQFEQGRIQGLKDAGISNREIARQLNRSHKVINNYVKNPSKYASKVRTGRPKILSPRDHRLIIQKASNSSLSINQIRTEIGGRASKSTVWRVLDSSPHIKSMKKKKKPRLRKIDKLNRVAWARKYFNWKSEWDKVIFSDEKKFNLDGPDGYRHYWHDLRKDPIVFSKRHSCHNSVVLWAGFNKRGKTSLAYLRGRADSKKYIDTLESHLLPSARKIAGKNWIFQQDNAPIHASGETQEWFRSKKIQVIDWPAYSPDLNPMENLWGILARKIYENNRQYDNIDQLKNSLEKVWDDIDQTILQRLVDSMPNRIFEVTRLNGNSIDY